jgi:hypothetical protein
MGEGTFADICTDFNIAVGVAPKTTGGLHEIVIHDAKDAEVLVGRVVVLGKGEVEPALQPVVVAPTKFKQPKEKT